MTVEWWNTAFQTGSLVLVLLTFALGAGALLTGNKINKRQSARMVALETDLIKAKTALAEQQERTTDAQLRLEEVHRAMMPRRIAMGGRGENGRDDTVVRQAKFAEIAKHKGTLALIHVVADPEAETLAGDIGSALQNSGWSVRMAQDPLSGRPRDLLMATGGVIVTTLEDALPDHQGDSGTQSIPLTDSRWSKASRAAAAAVDLLSLDLGPPRGPQMFGVHWQPEYRDGAFKGLVGVDVPDGAVVILVGTRPIQWQLTPLAWGMKK